MARRSTGLLVAVGLMTAPAIVLASHNFSDVGDGHPFHSEISAVANAGIARGFNDGTYRPGDAVTRQAMAAFLERGVGRASMDRGGFIMRQGSPGVVADVTVESGAAGNGGGFVLLQGNVMALSLTPAQCPCSLSISIEGDSTEMGFDVPGTASAVGYTMNSASISAVMPIEADTTRTYRLITNVLGAASGTPDINIQATFTALYVPLSADGDDTSTFERTCPQDDGYEQNDSIFQATNMYSGGNQTRPNAIVCPSDDDWFTLGSVSTSQTLTVAVNFQNAGGNIDICVVDETETVIACSISPDDDEMLEIVPPANGSYYIRVYLESDSGDPGNTYSVSKSVS